MEMEVAPQDDSFLMFETVFRKHGDLPEVLNFSVQLKRYRFDSESGGNACRTQGVHSPARLHSRTG
ncbi:hypothetical protein GGE35_001079 [Rhizobium cellulosilyticum]|jgi:hypothetical protein|uniref:Uncharacterized protein n=1 Tax=Aliirhizobium cellulosilyticum TaxID=393664 RepID=A0A7W6TBU3_9HYPH|nr:hypothetical protein [Rhizobium cellulosilyticum]MBB4410609.1 hypothetical protein [Rhizobium cellulosilyticum]MBB4445297.1 hypothetical protein [Rhizobium cellulosilyticum]